MPSANEFLEKVRENHGVVTSAQAIALGFSRGSLKHLTDTGRLEKSARGVYNLPESWGDEFVELQGRFKRGIFSYGTALFLWGLTDQTPNVFQMTFPQGYNLRNVKAEGVHCAQASKGIYEMGIAEAITPVGNKVRTYSVERTLCDILRGGSGADIQLVTSAFKQYAERQEKDLPRLSEYAKRLHVEDKLRSYLEVLL